MSNILVSDCKESHREFSKDLFSEVSQNLVLIPEDLLGNEDNNYKKVEFAVYVRTNSKDNLVLYLGDNKIAETYEAPDCVVNGGVYNSVLFDAGVMCGKRLVDSCFRFKSQRAYRDFVRNSVCYPVGAVENKDKYVLVFNVIMSSELLQDSEITFSDNVSFKPIKDIHKSICDPLQIEISKSLVEVQ